MGYYSMRVQETQEQRLAYAPLYLEILAGPKAPAFDSIVTRKPIGMMRAGGRNVS